MKKMFILAFFVAMAPLSLMAQDDDLYFNPKQEAKKAAAEREAMEREIAANYSGSKRSVDEYNRHGRFVSRLQKIGTDSLGNDIISFRVGKGVKPDSIYDDAAFVEKYLSKDDDYEYTRDMSRWDGYYDPWLYDFYGVGPYYWRSAYWGWRNPWRYGYYAGWYDPWFDPWYYGYGGYYAGWYDPWYYGWGGYYRPWGWARPVVVHTGHGGPFGGHRSWGGPGVGDRPMRPGGGRYDQAGVRRPNNQFGNMTRRNVENRSFSTFQRSSGFNNSRSFGNQGSFGNSGSFGGGSRSGGFSGGGGGGHFGGGGGFSGGGHFGGGRR